MESRVWSVERRKITLKKLEWRADELGQRTVCRVWNMDYIWLYIKCTLANSVVKHFSFQLQGHKPFRCQYKMAPNKPTQRCTPHGRANATSEKYKHPKCPKHQVSEALRLPHVWPHDVTGPIRSSERTQNNIRSVALAVDNAYGFGQKKPWLRTSHCQKVPGPPHRSTFHAFYFHIFSIVFKNDICCDIPYQKTAIRFPLRTVAKGCRYQKYLGTKNIEMSPARWILLSKD